MKWAALGAAHRGNYIRRSRTMEYMRRIIEHYITTALNAAGVRVDGDTYSELGSALEEIVKLEGRVQALEKELKDVNGYLKAKGWEE
jgi:hypothetical protein